MKWWSPPKQRQRWGESQILPSDNWGQIFFDLFYVGGAYNLGNVIKTSDIGARTILYFCATGFPSMMMWYDKLYFDARFTTRPGHDAFHRLLEILQLCCVATALSRIRSVDVLSHPCSHVDVFQFSTALCLHSCITLGRYVEVMKHAIGDPAAHVVAQRDIACRIIPTFFLLAAAVESGIAYYIHQAHNGGGEEYENCPTYENPVWYCLASWLSWVIIGYVDQVLYASKRICIDTTVPLNVHFCMHRYGEWFMLMFGESIMSLLIVEGNNEALDHSLKFYSGVLSVISLAHLHFQSEPNHNEDHALTRSRHSNYLYTVLVPIYSMALIATGICYKIFLYDYQSDADDGKYRRRLAESDSEASSYYAESSYYLEKKQQFTADLFSGSITIVLLCTDFVVLLHQGIHSVWNQIQAIPRARLVLLVASKYSLVFFLAVMSAFQNDPHFMAMFGLGTILIQEVLRRSFRAWQVRANLADDGSTDSDTTVSTSSSGFFATDDDNDDDENYRYEIQSFADAKMAFAKFEQQWMVEAKELQTKREWEATKDVYEGKPPCELPEETNKIIHTYYAC